MSNQLAFKLACGVVGSLLSLNVQAFPVSSPQAEGTVPKVIVVRDFCELGFHRSTHGHCIPDAASHLYPPPAYAPSNPGISHACPAGSFHLFPYSGCLARACTFGYYLGSDGQCYPYWRPVM